VRPSTKSVKKSPYSLKVHYRFFGIPVDDISGCLDKNQLPQASETEEEDSARGRTSASGLKRRK